MKYRVKYLNGIGFFAQVRSRFLVFFYRWETIGKHIHGFGLYDEDCIDHPIETVGEAQDRIDKYILWSDLKQSKPVYVNQ